MMSFDYSSTIALSLLKASTGPDGAQAEVVNAEQRLSVSGVSGGFGDATSVASEAQQVRTQAAVEADTSLSDARERGQGHWRRRFGGIGRGMSGLWTGQGRGVAIYTGRGSDSLAVAGTGDITRVKTFAGNDALSLAARSVSNVSTGKGADAVTIAAQTVSGVRTGKGGDALAISAGIAQGIYTGSGRDAVAVQAVAVRDLSTGRADDALSIDAGLIGEIRSGSGNDAVTISAMVGASQLDREVDGEWTAGDTAAERMANAVTGSTDIDLGSGDDVLTLSAQSLMAVAGGRGDDRMILSGGTIALGYRAGDGNDTVMLDGATEVVVQLGEDVGAYVVTQDEGALVLSFDGGSIRFEGVTDAAAIGVMGWGEDEVTMLQSPPVLDAQV